MESRKLSLYWEIIEFGVYLPDSFKQGESSSNEIPQSFHPFWSFSGQSESPEFKTVYFGYYPDNISIYYRKCEPKENAFRITMSKDDIKITHSESNEERSSLYFHLHHPPSFYREDFEKNKPDTPREELIWIVMKNMKDFIKEISNDELLKDYFLTNLVIKVTGKDWDALLQGSNFHFPKITTRSCESLPPRLTYKDFLQTNLTFDIKYFVRVWLSHRKTTIFELSKDFLTKLEKLDQRIVEKTCLDLAKTPSSFYCKEKLPVDRLFDLVYEKNELLKCTWESLEEYLGVYAPKSITITPNLIIYNVGLPVLSNAVFQSVKYRGEIWKVLRVKFRQDNKREVYRPLRDFGEERKRYMRNFSILDREYEFLAYSATQLKKGSLWMCLKENNASNRSLAERIRDDIGDLREIKILPKYGARLGQLFSSSFGSLPISYEIMVKGIEEKKSDWTDTSFSEGVGKISQSLMNEIQLKFKILGKISAVQIRLGSIKGVLTVDPELEGDQICFRDSMKKWPSSNFKDSLTILNYSKYEPAYLVRQIIYLLSFLKIEDKDFLDIQQENIKDLLEDESQNKDLIRYIRNCSPFPLTAQFLRSCFGTGIDLEGEPFLQGVRRVTTLGALVNIIGEGGLGPFVKDGAVFLGVLDEYDILEENEIYVCVSPSNGQDLNDIKIVEGETIVTKTPCFYPGDLRKLKAVGKEKVGEKFAHIVNCIVFSAKGKRPVTNMISGSDLDGDTFFVSWDKRLIPKEIVDAISYNVEDFPKELKGKLWTKEKENDEVHIEDDEVHIEDVLKVFEKIWRDKIGQTTNNCVNFMDHSLYQGDHKDEEKRKILIKELEERTQVFSLVVDYGKSGREWNNKAWEKQKVSMRPSKRKNNEAGDQGEETGWYYSTSVVTQLSENISERNKTYAEKIRQFQKEEKEGLSQRSVQINRKMIIPGFEEYLQLAFYLLILYYEETLAFMSFNGIKSEYEVFCGSFLEFADGSRNCHKRVQDLEKLQENCMVHIKLIQHKSMSLIESELEKRNLKINDPAVRNKVASAVYIMTYYNEECEIVEINSAIKSIKNREMFIFDSDKIPQFLGLPWYLFKDFMIERLLL